MGALISFLAVISVRAIISFLAVIGVGVIIPILTLISVGVIIPILALISLGAIIFKSRTLSDGPDGELRRLEVTRTNDWDIVGNRAAFRHELESIESVLYDTVAPTSPAAAIWRDKAAALRLQLEELEAMEARQASQRMQHSMYRAMLSDIPILAQEAPARAGQRSEAVSGGTAVTGYADAHVSLDGSTQLEEYINQLKIAEQPKTECYVCMEEVPCSQAVTLDNCGHFWCHECLRRCFDLAIKNEGGYPVRCCEQLPNIPMDNTAIASVLGDKMIIDLQAKITEYETENRTYCHEQSCSTFIPPARILERMAPCPACQQQTCAECKAQYHDSPDCSAVHDEAFEEWRTENQAATCPGCKRVILISQGCNHKRYFRPLTLLAQAPYTDYLCLPGARAGPSSATSAALPGNSAHVRDGTKNASWTAQHKWLIVKGMAERTRCRFKRLSRLCETRLTADITIGREVT
ncbi:hypothetical protein PV11_09004 [Exophiala sideris]|uniref:RBR-type E3 ubiquitin transferase n=1 Tax=Exophiala sideris TaxID=1016849 RepID=A0A0D1Y2Q4_9EURO|nr:hypothetical protein PV11_09004 [Exophiala sideris]